MLNKMGEKLDKMQAQGGPPSDSTVAGCLFCRSLRSDS